MKTKTFSITFFSLFILISGIALVKNAPLAKAADKCGTNSVEVAGVCIPTNTGLPGAENGKDPNNPVTSVAIAIMDWLLGIIGVIAVIAFVIAGIIYLTSAGDEDRIQQAKRAMTYSIIGVIVAGAGLVIILAIDHMLKGQIAF